MAVPAVHMPVAPTIVRERKDVFNSRRKPREDNGESDIAALLPGAKYEPWSYPLPSGFAFQPDFWVETVDAEYHVEVTFLDKPRILRLLGASKFRQSDEDKRVIRWQRKLGKIAETERLYGIPTLLVSYQLYVQIMERPALLQELIEEMLAKH